MFRALAAGLALSCAALLAGCAEEPPEDRAKIDAASAEFDAAESALEDASDRTKLFGLLLLGAGFAALRAAAFFVENHERAQSAAAAMIRERDAHRRRIEELRRSGALGACDVRAAPGGGDGAV